MANADDLTTRLIKVELDFTHTSRQLDNALRELGEVKQRVAKFEGYRTVFLTVASVLSGLGLGLAFWLNIVSSKAEKLPAIINTVTEVESRLSAIDKKREQLLADILSDVGPRVIADAQSKLPLPTGTVLMWWPQPAGAAIPSGWVACEELDGWTPQFELKPELLGHRTSMRATPGGEVRGDQINLSIVRIRCLMRK